jgi:hypothetical protein
MTKAQIVLEIVLLLQGTPVDEFARHNLAVAGNKVVVRCAQTTTVDSVEGQACKRGIATALLRYSYRFTNAQLGVLVDLYATALEQLEPAAVPRVRARMCDEASEEARYDAAAARAVCERLSTDF